MKKWCLCIPIVLLLICAGCGRQKEAETNSKEEQGISKVFEEESIQGVEAEEEEKQELQVYGSLVQIQADSLLGSGILWQKEEAYWVVVTAAHVVKNCKEAEVYLVEADKFLKAEVKCVEGVDLAFLVADIEDLGAEIQSRYEVACPYEETLAEKEAVIAGGYKTSGERTEYPGVVLESWILVEDFGCHMLLSNCLAEPGMSGGALVTVQGKLMGMICGKNHEGYLAVLPVSVISSEYQMFRNN